MDLLLEKCNICPHKCNVNRKIGKMGKCRSGENVKVALSSKHFFEEPCISMKNGSGTIFFSNCNLHCVYCQNYEISWEQKGKEISINGLSDIFIKQQQSGVNNINLVTPTIYVLQIKEAIKLAREKGLNIPIIYNSSGYESVETLKQLEGYIDVYLPDFKYYDNNVAYKYSGINNYFEYVTAALKEMYRQVGNVLLDESGIIKRGIIIRHMILPNNVIQTKKILRWIKDNLGREVYVSIMAQYFPTNEAYKYPEINRKINKRELKSVTEYLFELGFDNGYIQQLGKHEEEYVPDFNLDI